MSEAPFCTWLVSSAPWYVEPAIASGSFVAWLLFVRACELAVGIGWESYNLAKLACEPYRRAVPLVSRARQRLLQRLRRHRSCCGFKADGAISGTSEPSGRTPPSIAQAYPVGAARLEPAAAQAKVNGASCTYCY